MELKGWEGLDRTGQAATNINAFVIIHHSFHFISLPTQAPKKVTKKPAKKVAPKANPLFVAEPRSFRVGGAIRVRNAHDWESIRGSGRGAWVLFSGLVVFVVVCVRTYRVSAHSLL